MKVTLDTNVILSAYFWQGDSYKVMQLIPYELNWYISPFILGECTRIMGNPDLKFSHKLKDAGKTLDDIVTDMTSKSTLVVPTMTIHAVAKDPSDDHIIECAYASQSDFLISKDYYLLNLKKYANIPILRPEWFLEEYAKKKQ
ncbi:putative toxin-antitoxin system toxin component, PIN family [Candidatus Woesearchaeota archaeon]|nr:putative toxin-antitoxin system toxin component, PIN family [Candidatus Woesearchaeota archaeon]